MADQYNLDMADLPDPDIDPMNVDAAKCDADDDGADFELDLHGDDILFQQDLTGQNFLHSIIPKEQVYDFRPGERFQPADEFGAYIDDDPTGTYDPDARIYRPRRAGEKVGIERTEDEEAMRIAYRQAEARAIRLEHRAAKVNDASLIVTFPTSNNDDMRKWVEEIADNWAPDLNAEEVITTRFRRVQPVSEDLPLGNQPRIEDPAGVEFDLAHHPAARGCAGCRKLHIECSLLRAESDQAWPCEHCAQDSLFCELLTRPSLKKSCESCNERNFKCSYLHDLSYDHSVPCVRCLEGGQDCVAAPAEGGIRYRISYDKDHANTGKPVRKYKHCTACRKGKHPCSLKTVQDPPPCNRCRELGLNCVFWRVTGGGVPKADSEKKRQANRKKRELDNHLIVPKKTALLHPIKFLDDNPKRCSFCLKPNYGIIGMTGKFHEKFLTPTDGSHKEFHEAHAGSNPPIRNQCSRMCANCTMDRLMVLMCPGHELTEIPGLIKTTIDLENGGVTQEADTDRLGLMYTQMYNNRMEPDDAWCSLCVAPALHACCAFQETDKWGEPNELGDPKADGCGLKFCDSCNDEYNKQGWDLAKVLARIRKIKDGLGTKTRWFFGPRADAGFLMDDGVFEDGLLFRNVIPQD